MRESLLHTPAGSLLAVFVIARFAEISPQYLSPSSHDIFLTCVGFYKDTSHTELEFYPSNLTSVKNMFPNKGT